MRVKQIELIGFKSFSDKTVLRLHDGVTCIVGPNGCGKSNVVDAFKWVLGEQSVKSLRGDKMEEVIFQGSSTIKQKGMAEVTMQIFFSGKQATGDNNGSASGASVPRDETSVSRRLYRSGESEYLLNKSQSRLKDIKDIFLDTGLDVKSYSILDQGRVT
ncbi:MAG TPA: AAA family ATPase, partial [Dissulfurispiraceae bacterium]|nr:AAA family ATPase [Dissulfurispiraceae bacterium]